MLEVPEKVKVKVQDSISRLAAMARAVGIHLIVATQVPLASVLTGTIKANIPSRIAFGVRSSKESRVILDNSGAELLRGNGDMLFAPIGEREALRIQGVYISIEEIQKVTDIIKKQNDPNYSPSPLCYKMQLESFGPSASKSEKETV